MVAFFTPAIFIRPKIEFTFIGGNTSSGETITLPGGAQVGDLCVLGDHAIQVTGVPTDVTPSGFTELVNETVDAITDMRSKASYSVLTGTGTITGMTGGSSVRKVLHVYRPSRPISAITASTWTHAFNSGSSQTISASGQQTPILLFGMYLVGSDTFNSTTMNPAQDETTSSSSNRTIRSKYYGLNNSPQNHTISMSVGSAASYCVMGGYLIAT
jgi:membrane-associated protease RseP (regulator of RpoE activity)